MILYRAALFSYLFPEAQLFQLLKIPLPGAVGDDRKNFPVKLRCAHALPALF